MVDRRPLLQSVPKGRRPDRSDHELLDVDVGVGVGAAVDDVHHRYRQDVGVGAPDVAVERQLRRGGRGVRHRQRHPEDGVGAQLGLVLGRVQVQHRLIHQPLFTGVEADQLGPELVDHPEHGLGHTLAPVPGIPVPQLDRLERSGGGARRHRRAAFGPVVQDHFDLDGRVPAGVENLPRADELNTCHVWTLPFVARPGETSGSRCGHVSSHCGPHYRRHLSSPPRHGPGPQGKWAGFGISGPALG